MFFLVKKSTTKIHWCALEEEKDVDIGWIPGFGTSFYPILSRLGWDRSMQVFYNIASFDLLVGVFNSSAFLFLFFAWTMAFEAVHSMLMYVDKLRWLSCWMTSRLLFCQIEMLQKNNPPFVDVQTLHNRIVSDYHPWFCTHPFAKRLASSVTLVSWPNRLVLTFVGACTFPTMPFW